MNKKVVVIALMIACSFSSPCFAQNPSNQELKIGDALHRLSLEQTIKTPPLFIARDTIIIPNAGIAGFSIAATFGESKTLKSLIISMISNQTLPLSGEAEWLFPSGEQMNLYGKTTAMFGNDGQVEYVITFFSGLDDFCHISSKLKNQNVIVKIYSKKGVILESEIPSAFFALFSIQIE